MADSQGWGKLTPPVITPCCNIYSLKNFIGYSSLLHFPPPLQWESLALILVSSLVGADLNLLWPFLVCWDWPRGSLAVLWALLGVGRGRNESLSTPVVLQPLPGCVCHRAVHSDWADGSSSDDGGHRWDVLVFLELAQVG